MTPTFSRPRVRFDEDEEDDFYCPCPELKMPPVKPRRPLNVFDEGQDDDEYSSPKLPNPIKTPRRHSRGVFDEENNDDDEYLPLAKRSRRNSTSRARRVIFYDEDEDEDEDEEEYSPMLPEPAVEWPSGAAGCRFPLVGSAPPFAVNIDWKETGTEYVLVADVPGLSKEEVNVEVLQGRVLEISGDRKIRRHKQLRADEDTIWHCAQRNRIEFRRRFGLPYANFDRVKAVMLNGELTVTVPKEVPAASDKLVVKSIKIFSAA